VTTTEEVSTAHLTADEREAARIVGIGAVKYADLSMNRESNYRFSYKKMLSLNGNTAPYMLYAYARIQGIRRRAAQALGAEGDGVEALSGMTVEDLELSTPEEVLLVKQLLRLDEILDEVAKDLYPNKVCSVYVCTLYSIL
jgi:arginyl-tRNA synthetase